MKYFLLQGVHSTIRSCLFSFVSLQADITAAAGQTEKLSGVRQPAGGHHRKRLPIRKWTNNHHSGYLLHYDRRENLAAVKYPVLLIYNEN